MLRATLAIDPGGGCAARERPEAAAPQKDGGFRISRILVVCLGNVCRSPMAEHLLRRRLAQRNITVESAGLSAVSGAPIDATALEVLRKHGIDAGHHTAQRLDQKSIDRADLVLVMERTQLDFIRRAFPSAAGKTFLLGKWQNNRDVEDPFGQPQDTFEALFETVELAVDRWCELI